VGLHNNEVSYVLAMRFSAIRTSGKSERLNITKTMQGLFISLLAVYLSTLSLAKIIASDH
jgi:hypothetical protein